MSKKTTPARSIRHAIAFAMLSMASTYASAQTMTLQNNQLQISGGSGTTFSSQSPTISADGVVQTIIDVPSTNGVGIPSFSFTIVPDSVPNGSYNFRVGVTIDDDDNARRMEAKIETLTLTVSGSTITGTIPSGQNLLLMGRNGAGSLEVQASVANNGTNGPVRISGGKVTFDASDLIDRIRNAHASFDSIILAEFDDPASYTYRIAVQQTSGAPIQFGIDDGGFDDFPKVLTAGAVAPSVASTSAFVLNSSALAAGFSSAYTVTGQFNVVFISSGGSSGGGDSGGGDSSTPTGNVDTDTGNLNTALNNIDVTTGNTVSNEVVQQLNNVVNNTNTVLTNAASQLNSGTLSTSQALTALTTANSALDKAGTAAQKGGSVSTSSSTTAITNIANVVGALASKGNLTTEEKTQISTVATTTVTNATKLLTDDTPRSAILALVEATASLIQKSNDATGALTQALVTQVQALAKSATDKILPTLPVSIRGNTDLNSVDAIRALVNASASARATAAVVQPVIDDQWQQPGGRQRAQDGPLEPGSQQIRQTANMVDVHMCHYNRSNTIKVKINALAFRAAPVSLLPLKEAAVHEKVEILTGHIAVTTAGDPIGGAVMHNLRKCRPQDTLLNADAHAVGACLQASSAASQLRNSRASPLPQKQLQVGCPLHTNSQSCPLQIDSQRCLLQAIPQIGLPQSRRPHGGAAGNLWVLTK